MIPDLPSLRLLLSLLRRFALRYWWRHWTKLALLVGIVALGVGSFLAIGLGNRAATQSFDAFAQTVSGQSQIVVTASVGSLRIEDVKQLRLALLDTDASLFPQIIVNARLLTADSSGTDGAVFTLIGADLLAASNFLLRSRAAETYWDAPTNRNGPESSLPDTRTEGFYSQRSVADEYGWSQGTTVRFALNGSSADLQWLGSLPKAPKQNENGARALVIDWRELQRLLNRPGQVDRVDIVLPEQARTESFPDVVSRIQSANPGYWIVETSQQRQKTGATMTEALRMNLRALSVLSLCVAICLVFQAMDSAVARRQGEVSVLLSLGLSPRLARSLWLADAAVIGLFGGLGGVALGLVMARGSTALIQQTVATLYYRAGGGDFVFSPSECVLAAGLSVAACVAAGWWPARQAAKAPMAEIMRQGDHRSTYQRGRYIAATLLLLAVTFAAYQTPPIPAANGHAIPAGGYAMTLSLIGVVTCIACLALDAVGALTRPFGARFASLRIALSQFRMPVTRHRLALAGVTISIGMTAAMIFLIGSFESTVRAWISSTLQADLFIRSRSVISVHDESRIEPSLFAELMKDPRVRDGGSVSSCSIRIDDLPTQLIGYDTPYLERVKHVTWLTEPKDLGALADGDTTIVNESFASRFSKGVGDTVSIATRNGDATFRVIGIYADYGNESGSLGIDQSRYVELTGDPLLRAIALHVRDPESISELQHEIETRYPALNVMTNRFLREETLRIFKRVFAITYALEIVGLVISVAGLGSMLASLLIERRPEISALQRLGVSPSQIARSTLWEGLALATLGVIAGLALGGLLGLVLVYVINKQSFGWTLAVSVPWIELATLTVLTLAGASVVSYLVGRWASRLPILHEE